MHFTFIPLRLSSLLVLIATFSSQNVVVSAFTAPLKVTHQKTSINPTTSSLFMVTSKKRSRINDSFETQSSNQKNPSFSQTYSFSRTSSEENISSKNTNNNQQSSIKKRYSPYNRRHTHLTDEFRVYLENAEMRANAAENRVRLLQKKLKEKEGEKKTTTTTKNLKEEEAGKNTTTTTTTATTTIEDDSSSSPTKKKEIEILREKILSMEQLYKQQLLDMKTVSEEEKRTITMKHTEILNKKEEQLKTLEEEYNQKLMSIKDDTDTERTELIENHTNSITELTKQMDQEKRMHIQQVLDLEKYTTAEKTTILQHHMQVLEEKNTLIQSYENDHQSIRKLIGRSLKLAKNRMFRNPFRRRQSSEKQL